MAGLDAPLRDLDDPLRLLPLGEAPDADVVLPGSKSLTIRALLIAALAHGTSRLDGVLWSTDTEAVLGAIEALGVRTRLDRPACRIEVDGGSALADDEPVTVDLDQSATGARLLLAMSALRSGPTVVDGSAQLRSRPMGPGIDALRALGADVRELGAPGCLPVEVRGGAGRVAGGAVALPGHVSSQFASGLLIAGSQLRNGIAIELTTDPVSRPYLAMTAAVLDRFGAVRTGDLAVASGPLFAAELAIEPDASAASYVFALAAATGGRITVPGLGSGSLQGDRAFVDVLAAMGADVSTSADATTVRGSGRLVGVDVDLSDLSDTAPTMAVVAALATGRSTVSGIGFIRAKETDRVGNVVTELRRCGVDAREDPDGFTIVGSRGATPVADVTISTYDDHRMAMAFAVLALCRPGLAIADPACVAKTFPGFWAMLGRLGARCD